jgi:hypothetical protein
MKAALRPIVVAAAFLVVVGAGRPVYAQRVVARNSPPGATVEVLLNKVAVGSGTANPKGEAIITLKVPEATKPEIAVHVYVDNCGTDRRRVLLVEPGAELPALEVGCRRDDLNGTFVTRPITTFLVDVGKAPAVWLTQGPPPGNWYGEGAERPYVPRGVPTGLGLSGGGNLVMFNNTVGIECGTLDNCSGTDKRIAWTVGADYWFTRFLGAEVSYLNSAKVNAHGEGFGADANGNSVRVFAFNTSVNPSLATFAAKVGIPIQVVRVYGKAGANFSTSDYSTTETVDSTGDTKTWTMTAKGWGWMFAVGLEGWVTPRLGIYAEGGHFAVRGKGVALDGNAETVRDGVDQFVFGLRLHVW